MKAIYAAGDESRLRAILLCAENASSPAEETGITITYTYDPLDRLTAVTGPVLVASLSCA